MQEPQLNRVTNFTGGITDNVLRDLYVRGKYPDVILPIIVLRRFGAVLDIMVTPDAAGITHQDQVLREAAQPGNLEEPAESDRSARDMDFNIETEGARA